MTCMIVAAECAPVNKSSSSSAQTSRLHCRSSFGLLNKSTNMTNLCISVKECPKIRKRKINLGGASRILVKYAR